MSAKIDLSGLFSGGFSFDLNGDGKGIDDYVEDFVDGAGEVWNDITDGVENAYNDVVDWASDVADDVSQWFEDAGAYMANAAESAFNAVGVALDGIASWWETTAAPFLESAGIFILDVLEGTAATITTILFSLVEGILQFGEALVDLIVMLGTAIASIGTGIYDGCQAIYGAITGEEWESATGNMWDAVMGFVAVDGIKTMFDGFYEDTAMGNWMAENTPFFDTVRSVSSGIGYVAGIVILTIVTFGAGGAAAGAGAAGSTAVTVTAGQLATTAGVVGFSSGTADAWADGASLFEGFGYGTLNGLWEATQWYVGGKIGGLNLFGKGATTTGTKVLNSFARVLLDGFDGSLEGFMQPFLKTVYKDGYYDENGQLVAFTEDDNLWERFVEMFDDAGGFQNVLTQGLIGSGGSLLGEAFDLTKFLKGSDADVTAKIDTGSTVTLELDPDRTLTLDLDPDKTLELDGNVTAKINTNPISQEQIEQSLSSFWTAMTGGKQSDLNILNFMYTSFYSQLQNGNTNALAMINAITTLKSLFSDFTLEGVDGGSYWDPSTNTLCLSSKYVDWGNEGTLWHEMGHALLDKYLLQGRGLNANWNWDNLVRNAQLNASTTNYRGFKSLQDYLGNLSDYFHERAKTSFFDNLAQQGKTYDQYRQELISYYSQLDNFDLLNIMNSDRYSNTIRNTVRDVLDNNGDGTMLWEALADLEIRDEISSLSDRFYRTEGNGYDGVSDIIAAIFGGKNVDAKGRNIYWSYSHSADYFKSDATNPLHEIVANFTELKMLGNEQAVTMLKDIFGSDMFNFIEDIFAYFDKVGGTR